MSDDNNNGWMEWKNYVVKELDTQKRTDEDQWEEITKLKVEQAVLKVKSGIWGAIGALIPIIVALLIYLVRISLVT